jgi:hypothetical protein
MLQLSFQTRKMASRQVTAASRESWAVSSGIVSKYYRSFKIYSSMLDRMRSPLLQHLVKISNQLHTHLTSRQRSGRPQGSPLILGRTRKLERTLKKSHPFLGCLFPSLLDDTPHPRPRLVPKSLIIVATAQALVTAGSSGIFTLTMVPSQGLITLDTAVIRRFTRNALLSLA